MAEKTNSFQVNKLHVKLVKWIRALKSGFYIKNIFIRIIFVKVHAETLK